MTEVSELLRRRSEGWESEPDEAGQGLYYTEKQTRVFKEIVENPNANIKTVADRANVHPSYVRYIINRLPKDKATDREWLQEKAGVEGTIEEPEGEGESEEDRGPPALSAEEEGGESTRTRGEDSIKKSFGVGDSDKPVLEQMAEAEDMEVQPGQSVSVTIPVTVSISLPDELTAEVEREVIGEFMETEEAPKGQNNA